VNHSHVSPVTASTLAPRRQGLLSRLFRAMVNLYALLMIVYLLLRLVFADDVWWLAAINNFTPFLFLLALLLTAAAVLARSPIVIARTLPFALIALVWFGPYFLPKSTASAPPDAVEIKVLTFNIYFDNRDPGVMLDWLKQQSADIVMLQEVTRPILDRLHTELEGLYEIVAAPWLTGGSSGTATLVRYPVVENRQISLFRRLIQRSVIEIDGQSVAVYNVHLSLPEMQLMSADGSLRPLHAIALYDPSWRNSQINLLVDLLQQERLPYIVAGDFNTSDQSEIYHALASVMNDSFRTAGIGLGLSWPARRFLLLPTMVRIDYVWHSDHFQTREAYQGPYLLSDHLPLLASLTVTDS
jgi:vancomycin resistance protein VanJ